MPESMYCNPFQPLSLAPISYVCNVSLKFEFFIKNVSNVVSSQGFIQKSGIIMK